MPNKFERKNQIFAMLTIMNKRAPSHNIPEEMKINGTDINDPNIIADAFNDYFIQIGRTLANSIPPNNIDPLSYLDPPNANSLFLTPATQSEVEYVITDLNNSSSGEAELSTIFF